MIPMKLLRSFMAAPGFAPTKPLRGFGGPMESL